MKALKTAPSCTSLSENSRCSEEAATEMLLRSRKETAATTKVQKITTQRLRPLGLFALIPYAPRRSRGLRFIAHPPYSYKWDAIVVCGTA